MTIGVNQCLSSATLDLAWIKEDPHTLAVTTYPYLIDVELPTLEWEAWVWGGATIAVGVTLAFVLTKILCKGAPAKKKVRMDSENLDLRKVSTAELESLPSEEREALKQLLYANI